MDKTLAVLDQMRDQLLRLEYCLKDRVDDKELFDTARNLLREHNELVSELGSALAYCEDLRNRLT